MFDWLMFDTSLLSDPVIISRLILQCVLFGLSAFFSMSETALFSLSTLDFQKLRDEKHPQSDNLHKLLDYPRVLIVSILCGNELVNIAATVNLAGVLLALYGDPDQAGWINIIIMFPLLLMFGEITPKTIAVTNTYNVSAKIVSAPINLWVKFIKPVRSVVMLIANFLTSLFIGEQRKQENLLGVDEIKTLLEEANEHGELSAIERVIIDNLLDAKDAEVVEVMIPRPRLIFLDIEQPLPVLVEQLRRYKRARFPAYKGHPDNIVGMINTNDIAALILAETDLESVDINSILRPVVAVPETKTIHEMLDLFRRENTTAALIFNEWGSVDGFVTLRQVLRYFVGAIATTSDADQRFDEIEPGQFRVSGQMNLERVNDIMNTDLELARMTTIGGLIFQQLDRLPRVGDKVELSGLNAEVIKMKGHRIDRVDITSGSLLINDAEDYIDEENPEQSVLNQEETRR